MPCMPAEVRDLANPWRSLVGSVPGLTAELENEFRFGQKVIFFNGLYRLGGNIKGGSSSIWSPSNVPAYQAYCGWKDVDGIPAEENPAAFDELLTFLRSRGVKLVNGNYYACEQDDHLYCKDWGYLYAITLSVLRALPEQHAERAEFRTLQLGGWGPDCAKGSAYDDATVNMYEFAVEGARRTYVGLLLHELGHAQEAAFDGPQHAVLYEHYKTIVAHKAVLGVEYLLDAETRRIYQLRVFEEFLPEVYMIYASQGERLRRYMAEHPPAVRAAWQAIYEIYRKAFDGIEYA
ncbi:MAG: hypothetical protein HZA54_18800 [Planctomycetes bacterium]|nr:hypothetical protein [Planctomycetota bacterium]